MTVAEGIQAANFTAVAVQMLQWGRNLTVAEGAMAARSSRNR